MLKSIFKDLAELIKRYILLIILITLLIIKLIIVGVQPINARYYMYIDDELMCEQAESIVSGNWLGEYNSRTLVKGVVTPLFIALMYILNVPFLVGKEILYGVACIVFTLIISKKIKNKIALILIYLVILMNPIEYSAELSRVYRDGIYAALIIFLLAFSIGIFLNRKEKARVQVKYFIGLGLSFCAAYLCREETIWLLPFLVIITLVTIIPNFLNKKILLYLIPIFITLILANIVCLLNYKYYGVYTLNEYFGKAFKAAYGALLRVEPEEEIQRVPITRETMQRLYELSPKFAELEEYLEGEIGDGWRSEGIVIEGELSGSYVQWALMDAVSAAGYYETAEKAEQYYMELADEINQLCDEGIIESRSGKIVSNTCYYTLWDLIRVITKMPEIIKFQYSLEDVSMQVDNDSNNNIDFMDEVILFEKMTNQSAYKSEYYSEGSNYIRLRIIEFIEKIYEYVNPYIFYISIIAAIIFVISNIKKIKEVYEEIIILLSIAILYASRIYLITFTREMMFEEIFTVQYLSSIYSIQFLFGIISILLLIRDFRRKYIIKKNNKKISY